MPELTVQDVKDLYPDVYGVIQKEGFDKGLAEGKEAGRTEGVKEGAEAERTRIQAIDAVEKEPISKGHIALIQGMKFDGESTADKVKLAVLDAENEAMKTRAKDFKGEDLPKVSGTDAGDGRQKEKEKADSETPEQAVDRLTKERKEKDKITYTEAMRLVMKENPDLAKAYTNQERR